MSILIQLGPTLALLSTAAAGIKTLRPAAASMCSWVSGRRCAAGIHMCRQHGQQSSATTFVALDAMIFDIAGTLSDTLS